jgi:enoyl-CoA hydratase/carnithine racemase
VLLAEEANRLGLVDEVHPADQLLPAALAFAAHLADNCAPSSLAAIKAQIYADLRGDLAGSATDALARTRHMVNGNDFREGVAAFREKRNPVF